MDRAFLTYYTTELTHLRTLANEFAAMHPNVAQNLQLDTVPCADPYVERLLEGVAYLGARTRLKLDQESRRSVLAILDALYPDLAGPAPAVAMAELTPGPQVQGATGGHRIARGTRFVAGLTAHVSTRATYTNAQGVTLFPLRITEAEYLPDPNAVKACGLPGAEAGIRIAFARTNPGPVGALTVGEYPLDALDVYLGGDQLGHMLFDAVFGAATGVFVKPGDKDAEPVAATPPQMVGIGEDESVLPRVRSAFEGYRLLREYFMLPQRFYYLRAGGIGAALAGSSAQTFEILLPLKRAEPAIADIAAKDFALFTTPLVNLFERECNFVDVDPARRSHVVHADRTRPRDFEIYRVLKVEDADRDGPDAAIHNLYDIDQPHEKALTYTTKRRPRRASTEELASGKLRSPAYSGDDVFISVSRTRAAEETKAVRRLDIRALCSNRDLPLLDPVPNLSPESGEPISKIRILGHLAPPTPALTPDFAESARPGETADDIAWRWIAQLNLNFIALSEDDRNGAPLRSLLELYADRGDGKLIHHGQSIAGISTRPAIERIALDGPAAFAHGTEVTLEIDQTPLAGSSSLLLSAILSRLFARQAAINSFVRTRTRLLRDNREVDWPYVVGKRGLV